VVAAVAAAVAAPTDVAVGPPRSIPASVVLYWCTFLAVGLSVSILGPALTDLRERSGTDIGGIGVLFVAQAAGYVVGSMVGGRLFDRFDGHRVFAGALLVMAGGLIAVSTLSTIGALFGVFLMIGVGASTVDVGANALLMWELGDQGGRAMNVLHLCFGLGALSAPLMVHIGLDTATRLAALGCLGLAVLALRVTAPVVRPVADDQDADPSPRLLALLASFFLLYVGLEVGFAGWVHTYGEEIGFSAAAATWLTTVFWVGFTAGRLASSAIAHRFRPKVVLIAACGLTVVAAVALVLGDGRPAPVWVATALFGVATAPQFPVMLNYLERRIHVTGSATSWFIGAAGVGGLVFPWMIGRWIDATDESALPWAMLVLSVATVVSFAASNRRLGG
jgi:FHS family Na+ dependent glucose MFS transporter 1